MNNDEMEKVLLALSQKYSGDFNKMYMAIQEREFLTSREIEVYISSIHEKYTSILSRDYPAEFQKMNCPPIVLYYEGDLDLANDSINELALPDDPSQRFFINIEPRDGEIHYIIGCENEEALEEILEHIIGRHTEFNFHDYSAKEDDELCLN